MRKLQRPIDVIITELLDWINTSDLSQSEISRRTGVGQCNISRLLKGESNRHKLSRPLERLCNYAKIPVYVEKKIEPRKSKVLMNALESVWDGTPMHAKRLANIIRQVGKLGC